jgi:hypothetical protein
VDIISNFSCLFVGGFLLYLGFHVGFGCCGYVVSYGFFMWASWVAPVYLGAPYAFLVKFSYVSKKKISHAVSGNTFGVLFVS